MRKLIAALLMVTTLAPVAAAAQVGAGAEAGLSRRGELRRLQENRVGSTPAIDRIGSDDRRGDGGPRRQRGERPSFQTDRSRLDNQRTGRGPDRIASEPSFGMDQRYPRRADQPQDRRAGDRESWRDRGDRRDRIQQGDDRRRYEQRRNDYGNRTGWADGAYDRRRFDDRRGWNRGWRTENRYDWARYRGVNRSAYRLPRYYAPHGWNGYRRLSAGVSLSSALWGRDYWIGDPWSYRLPDAYGPYRWVRYYDDALLVDLESGDIVDAVYGIFW